MIKLYTTRETMDAGLRGVVDAEVRPAVRSIGLLRAFAQKSGLRFLLRPLKRGVYACGPPSRPSCKVPEARDGGLSHFEQ